MPRILSNHKIEQIISLNKSGETNRKIAKLLDVNHRTVSYYLAKNGFKSNFANQPIEKVSDTEAKCSRCKETKPIENFQYGRRGQKYEYKFSYCNLCRKKQTYLNLNSSLERFLSDRYNRLRRRANKEGITFSISLEEFIGQYRKQNGKCFYSDRDLICEVGVGIKSNAFSVDKIVPDDGYINGNVVFCINKINTCKNDLSIDEIKEWMPGWHQRILDFRKE